MGQNIGPIRSFSGASLLGILVFRDPFSYLDSTVYYLKNSGRWSKFLFDGLNWVKGPRPSNPNTTMIGQTSAFPIKIIGSVFFFF